MREVHFKRQLSFQYFQISVKPCLNVSGKQILHCGKLALDVVFIKSVIISQAIGKLDVNWRISCFHKLKIYQQAPGSAVAVASCTKNA